jgi:hypothetical protein
VFVLCTCLLILRCDWVDTTLRLRRVARAWGNYGNGGGKGEGGV